MGAACSKKKKKKEILPTIPDDDGFWKTPNQLVSDTSADDID